MAFQEQLFGQVAIRAQQTCVVAAQTSLKENADLRGKEEDTMQVKKRSA